MRERFLILHKSGAILKTNEVTDSDLGAAQLGFSRVVDLEDMTVMHIEQEADRPEWLELPLRTFDDEAEEEDEEEVFLWSHVGGARRPVFDPRSILAEAVRNFKPKRKVKNEDTE